jgi:hypothetical protein
MLNPIVSASFGLWSSIGGMTECLVRRRLLLIIKPSEYNNEDYSQECGNGQGDNLDLLTLENGVKSEGLLAICRQG